MIVSESNTIEVNGYGLEKLQKLLKGNKSFVKVGILGDKDSRSDDGGNASIGARHEFGTSKLPMRSFLRMPLNEKLQEALNNAGALDEETLKAIVKEGDLSVWLKKIGIIAESVIADAFATRGFGKWKPSDMTYKKVHQTLVETQQLRNSITSSVESKDD